MKTFCSILGACILIATSNVFATSSDYQLSLSSPNTVFFVGDDIPIGVHLKNTSGHTTSIDSEVQHDEAEFDNRVVLKKHDGSSPNKTPFYLLLSEERSPASADGRIRPGFTSEKQLDTLAPHESLDDTLLLNTLYELEPATYRVYVVRHDGVSGSDIRSNTLTIIVAAKPH